MTETPRRTQRERVEESNRRLTRAAIELIAEKGFAATTAAEIGIQAGYSRGMVSARYGTKEALLDTILTEQYESRLDPPSEPGTPGIDRVLARLDRLRAFAVEDPDLLRAILVLNFEAAREDGGLRIRIRQWLDQFLGGLTEEIRAGQGDGSVNGSLDADEQAAEIIATGIGYAYSWIVEPDRVDLAHEVTRWSTRVAVRLRPTPRGRASR